LAVSGTVHKATDLGFGFPLGSRMFRLKATYSRRAAGFTGFCRQCRKEGRFLLPQEEEPGRGQ
jgi:hypothetical protein